MNDAARTDRDRRLRALEALWLEAARAEDWDLCRRINAEQIALEAGGR
jgi:hypothetical protein